VYIAVVIRDILRRDIDVFPNLHLDLAACHAAIALDMCKPPHQFRRLAIWYEGGVANITRKDYDRNAEAVNHC
jgi:hypothetical protein